jgi:arginase family enzyme
MKIEQISYFGIRSFEQAEIDLVEQYKVPVYYPNECKIEDMDTIKKDVMAYFASKGTGKEPCYWISFDIDGLCASEFGSTGTPELEGISLDFTMALFEAFLPYAVGMDISEVNLNLAKDENEKEKDLKTFIGVVKRVLDIVSKSPSTSKYQPKREGEDTKNEAAQQILDSCERNVINYD